MKIDSGMYKVLTGTVVALLSGPGIAGDLPFGLDRVVECAGFLKAPAYVEDQVRVEMLDSPFDIVQYIKPTLEFRYRALPKHKQVGRRGPSTLRAVLSPYRGNYRKAGPLEFAQWISAEGLKRLEMLRLSLVSRYSRSYRMET